MKVISIVILSLMMSLVAYGSYSLLGTKKNTGQIDFSSLTLEQTRQIYQCKSGNDCLIDRYSACSRDDECVLVKGSCGYDVSSVNQQYETEASAYFAYHGTMVDCADKPTGWQNPSASVCKSNKCEVLE